MNLLPASREWMAFVEARDEYRRLRTDEAALAMTNAWYDWRASVELHAIRDDVEVVS